MCKTWVLLTPKNAVKVFLYKDTLKHLQTLFVSLSFLFAIQCFSSSLWRKKTKPHMFLGVVSAEQIQTAHFDQGHYYQDTLFSCIQHC